MEGYHEASYGDAYADVYDDWYGTVSDVAATVDLVSDLAATPVAAGEAGAPAGVLELGVGTGRLAVPLAASGLDVHGIDTSAAMLARLAERDPDRAVAATLGDMVDDLPAGPFDVVLAAFNTLFNLHTAARQRACFAAVAARLRRPAGAFVVEAAVPAPPRAGSRVAVRSMAADRVVLEVTVHDAVDQLAEGQLVELVDGAPVRLRPWRLRLAGPAELDDMAAAAGLVLAERWAGVDRSPFDADSGRHVSVYRCAG